MTTSLGILGPLGSWEAFTQVAVARFAVPAITEGPNRRRSLCKACGAVIPSGEGYPHYLQGCGVYFLCAVCTGGVQRAHKQYEKLSNNPR